jgi:hypothetical protein
VRRESQRGDPWPRKGMGVRIIFMLSNQWEGRARDEPYPRQGFGFTKYCGSIQNRIRNSAHSQPALLLSQNVCTHNFVHLAGMGGTKSVIVNRNNKFVNNVSIMRTEREYGTRLSRGRPSLDICLCAYRDQTRAQLRAQRQDPSMWSELVLVTFYPLRKAKETFL